MPTTGGVCPVKICCNPKGPIIFEGSVEITDKYGRPLASDSRKKMYVLRGCGQSNNKPFCDGAHNKGTQDANESGKAKVNGPCADVEFSHDFFGGSVLNDQTQNLRFLMISLITYQVQKIMIDPSAAETVSFNRTTNCAGDSFEAMLIT